jgi:hypothetical protein
MQNLKQKKDLNGTRRLRCLKLLFVGTKTFMKATKRGDAFLIYILPLPDVEPHPHDVPSQYQQFKDVFEKKNANTLSKHQPYDYTIDLVEGTQPSFRPIIFCHKANL